MFVFQAISEDVAGSRSELLDMNVYVLEFPCENNATCQGPVGDPTCNSTNRAFGTLKILKFFAIVINRCFLVKIHPFNTVRLKMY